MTECAEMNGLLAGHLDAFGGGATAFRRTYVGRDRECDLEYSPNEAGVGLDIALLLLFILCLGVPALAVLTLLLGAPGAIFWFAGLAAYVANRFGLLDGLKARIGSAFA